MARGTASAVVQRVSQSHCESVEVERTCWLDSRWREEEEGGVGLNDLARAREGGSRLGAAHALAQQSCTCSSTTSTVACERLNRLSVHFRSLSRTSGTTDCAGLETRNLRVSGRRAWMGRAPRRATDDSRQPFFTAST